MILVKHDIDNKVIAYVDYDVVDIEGKSDCCGEYAYVRYYWVHDDYRWKNLIKYFVEEAKKRHYCLKYIYYNRFKYNDRMKMYKIGDN